WMVYTLTGSKLLMGTLFAVNAIPNIVLSPFSGVFADHFKKKRTIVICDLGRGLVVMLTAILFGLGHLRTWHLFAFTIMNSTLETFSQPVRTSIMPLMLTKEQFLGANAISSSISSLAQLIGLGAAGFLIATIDISGAIFVDALTFFISAILIFLMVVKGDVKSDRKLDTKTYVADLSEGFKYIAKNKLILLTVLAAMVVNFSLAPINVLEPVYAKEILKSGPEVMSYMGIAVSAGVIISGILVGQFGSRFKKSLLVTIGFVLLGVSYTALSLPELIQFSKQNAIIIAVGLYFIFGLAIPPINATVGTYMLENTKQELLGRVSSLLTMVCLCAAPIGSALTGVVAEFASISTMFISMGALVIIVGLALLFNKDFRNA
ncbi:MAG: major facilitator superfamily 1, partial [Clostridiales bacterium]|nr:major facilitator superfamily 1 [Clostridiales bacterium]